MKLKIFAVFLVLILVLNLTLFILKKLSPYIFWLVIIVIAIIAYKAIPISRIKKS